MKKRILYITVMIIGIILIAFSLICVENEAYKMLNGALLGIGAGGVGLALSNLLMLSWYDKHPKELRLSEIEAQDERNEMIRNKAKAKASDIIQWTVMILAWITIFADLPLWITLLLVSVFLFKNILELALMNTYSNEM